MASDNFSDWSEVQPLNETIPLSDSDTEMPSSTEASDKIVASATSSSSRMPLTYLQQPTDADNDWHLTQSPSLDEGEGTIPLSAFTELLSSFTNLNETYSALRAEYMDLRKANRELHKANRKLINAYRTLVRPLLKLNIIMWFLLALGWLFWWYDPISLMPSSYHPSSVQSDAMISTADTVVTTSTSVSTLDLSTPLFTLKPWRSTAAFSVLQNMDTDIRPAEEAPVDDEGLLLTLDSELESLSEEEMVDLDGFHKRLHESLSTRYWGWTGRLAPEQACMNKRILEKCRGRVGAHPADESRDDHNTEGESSSTTKSTSASISEPTSTPTSTSTSTNMTSSSPITTSTPTSPSPSSSTPDPQPSLSFKLPGVKVHAHWQNQARLFERQPENRFNILYGRRREDRRRLFG